jgi:F-type H+-transporting ATPase subunit b
MSRLARVAAGLLAALISLHAQEGAAAPPEPDAMWKWANFVLLALALAYMIGKIFPPLFKSRSAEIQQGIAEAQKIRQDAEQRAAAVEAKTRTLAADIERFRAESKIEMQQEAARIRQETADQIARLEHKAQEDIEASGKTARRELKSYAAKLALDLAEQRVRARLDAPAEKSLVDGFIHSLERESKN